MIRIKYFDREVKEGNLTDLEKIKKFPLWIDSSAITQKEAEIIKESFNLHPLTQEDLLSWNARIKVEEFNDYLFSVFNGIKNSKKKIELYEIDFVIGQNYLITNHKEEIDSHLQMLNDQRLKELFKKGPDFLFHKLLDAEIDNFFPVLEKIDDDIERIEETVLKSPKPEMLSKILEFKRRLVLLKRGGFQQRDKILYLAKNEYNFISKKARPYFRDIYDHAIRVSDSIDNYREAIGETFDAYMSALNNNMNEVMKVLSVFATIALPMTVISGIYGTNFENLPGSKLYFGF